MKNLTIYGSLCLFQQQGDDKTSTATEKLLLLQALPCNSNLQNHVFIAVQMGITWYYNQNFITGNLQYMIILSMFCNSKMILCPDSPSSLKDCLLYVMYWSLISIQTASTASTNLEWVSVKIPPTTTTIFVFMTDSAEEERCELVRSELWFSLSSLFEVLLLNAAKYGKHPKPLPPRPAS